MVEEILTVIKNITVFILLFSLITNLFSNSKYDRYFRFVEGLIVIMIVMAPLFSWFTSDRFLDECLDKNIFEMENRSYEDEIRVIEEQRDQMLKKSWMEEGADENAKR